MIADWKKEIAVAWYVQNETAKFDNKNLWSYFLPRTAAAEQDLARTEGVLGYTLDPRYREFLGFANGWRCFYQKVDLLGTIELSDGAKMQRAREAIEEGSFESISNAGGNTNALLPIGWSGEQTDIFVIAPPHHADAGAVFWLAGYEVERFATFDDFFLAMVDYNRLRCQRLKSEHG